ncbi:MAG: GNAT family N-acetyltransferase [Acidimicrobiales bacterium]
MTLQLRPYNETDESAAVAIHQAMLADDFFFLLFWEPTMTWGAFLASVDELRRGITPPQAPPHRVRSDQLAAVVDGEIVGRVSVRFELNEYLSERGGHVGYGVAPAHRARGYATEILRQALVLLRSEGVGRVLVTCDDNNAASARVIEKNGGVLESISPPLEGDAKFVRRYWID